MPEGTEEKTPEQKPEPADAGRTFTQEDVNRFLAEDRRKNEAKYAGFDEIKAKADKFDQAEAANKTELQKAQDAAAAAEKRATDAEAKVLRATVAAAKGVPAELLTGSTQADLEASADALLTFKGALPKAPPAEGTGASIYDEGDGMSATDIVKAARGR